MKKFPFYFLITVVIFITTNGLAQDTIFMKNNQHIPANIIEVSSTEVKYKRFEISDGPVYIEKKSMIFKIKYKNGFTDVFPVSATPVVNSDAEYRQPETEYRQSKDQYKPSEGKPTSKYPDLSEWGRGKFMYGDKIIGEHKMHRTLLALNDIKITEQIMNAKQSRALKYIGFATIPLGIASFYYAFRSDNTNIFYSRTVSAYTRERYKKNSIVLGGGAVLCLGASIYFGIDRKNKNRRAVELYEEHYANR